MRGSLDFLQGNITLGAFFGYGYDEVLPLTPPPGQASDWPAHHQRWNLGLTYSQLLSPIATLTLGAAGTFQRGRLSNPYRRAIVHTTLFPEALPSERDRLTAFAGASIYLGSGFALHLRQGIYADSWRIWSLIPEVALAKDFGPRISVYAQYRYYHQWGAPFYAVAYQDVDPIMSGDPRTGSMREHATGVGGRFALLGDLRTAPGLVLSASYDFSHLVYQQLGTVPVIGHIVSLALSGSY